MADVTTLARSRELSREVWKFQNEVRQNPKVLIPLLEEDLKYFQGKSIWAPGQPGMATEEGPPSWKEAISFIQQQPALPALEWNDGLAAAAMDHAYDLGPKGRTGHVGSDKSSISDRVRRHGNWLAVVGENISFGPADARYIIKQLIVDDGTPSRGHRTNIFTAEYGAVGIAAAPHKTFGSVCVLDYAGGMAPGGTGPGYAPAIDPSVFDIAVRKEAELARARALAGDMPLGCVSRSVKTTTRVAGGRRTVTTTTTFKFADGREETRVHVEESAQPAHSPQPPPLVAQAPAARPKALSNPTSTAPGRPAAGKPAAARGPRASAARGVAGAPFAHLFGADGAAALRAGAAGAGIGIVAEYRLCDRDELRPVDPVPPAASAAPAPAHPRLPAPRAASRAGPAAVLAGVPAGRGAGAPSTAMKK
jgi:hypothetical protein